VCEVMTRWVGHSISVVEVCSAGEPILLSLRVTFLRLIAGGDTGGLRRGDDSACGNSALLSFVHAMNFILCCSALPFSIYVHSVDLVVECGLRCCSRYIACLLHVPSSYVLFLFFLCFVFTISVVPAY